jgi:uridine kinase
VENRARVLADLADVIVAVRRDHPTRVAVDGFDAAGKTTLADELALLVHGHGRKTIRVSLDDFHLPRSRRYRRGELSATGYYDDSFDRARLRASVLDSLGPDGDRIYRPAAFDLAADRPAPAEPRLATADAVLLVDGVFLQQPGLDRCWDLTIWVDVAIEESIRRGVARDRVRFGNVGEARRRYLTRYAPAQRMYLDEVDPADRADVVFDNADPASPVLQARVQTFGTKP